MQRPYPIRNVNAHVCIGRQNYRYSTIHSEMAQVASKIQSHTSVWLRRDRMHVKNDNSNKTVQNLNVWCIQYVHVVLINNISNTLGIHVYHAKKKNSVPVHSYKLQVIRRKKWRRIVDL